MASVTSHTVGKFMVAVGAILEQSDGKILVVKRSKLQDFRDEVWEIPYGRLNQFEDLETGLRREMDEELGLKDFEMVKLVRYWHIFRGAKKAENELIGLTFHCRVKRSQITLSSEHTHYRWLMPKAALNLITIEGIRQDLQAFLKRVN